VKGFLKPRTLFRRTAYVFTLAFLIFSLFSLGVVIYFVAIPLTKRAADDLSALIVLSAQIWVELPPGTRPDFEREMLRRHKITIALADDSLPRHDTNHLYIQYVEEALLKRTGKPHPILFDEAHPDLGWVDIPMGGRVLRIGYDEDKLIARLPSTLLTMILAGILLAIMTSLLWVRKITRPLANLVEATTRIGLGRQGEPLEERGAAELVELTRNFNLMEKQIKVLMENRTTLLAGISHDLRTPIARMQLELELLEEDPDPELLDGLRQDLAEMNEIITTTLEFSKGLGDQRLETVDLVAAIKDIAQNFRRRGAEIDLQLPVRADCTVSVSAFRRVINNLLENAVRYGNRQMVSIRCRRRGPQIHFEIIDRGSGIPAELREQVLQPFKRLEGSRNRASGGSGLGLAIVEQLCRSNDWRLELDESEYGGLLARVSLRCGG
jgi:two-component system osmolarity sensor histidine kinase EnvZ